MRFRVLTACLILSILASPMLAQPKPKAKRGRTYTIPYRLTKTQHLLVRVKLNGKGPYNFILDTGAPFLIASNKVGKELGVKKDGWVVLKRLELEGGATLPKQKLLVTTPYQLTGMNALGMAGVELHGIIGFTVLAQYRIEYDLTKTKMKWTHLPNFKPPAPGRLEIKGGKNPTAGMDMLAGVMQFLGAFSGMGVREPQPRGFFGIGLAESKKGVRVTTVLPDSPAAKAGLKRGDVIREVGGKSVATMADVHKRTARVSPGKSVAMMIERGTESKEITITAGEGL